MDRAAGTTTWARLAQYQRQVRLVSDALHLYPVTQLIARLPLNDDVIGAHTVRAGQNVLVSFIGVNHCQALQATLGAVDINEGFERLAYGDGASFTPGPRMCRGKQFAMLEVVSVLATFLAKARFSLMSGVTPKYRWKGQMLNAGRQPVRVDWI